MEFIKARIAEDQQVAREATAGQSWSREPHSGRWRSAKHGCDWGAVDDETGGVIVFDEGAPSEAQAAHIARHDPARALREVTAVEVVLAFRQRLVDAGETDVNGYPLRIDRLRERQAVVRHLTGVLEALAVIWADHSDYRDEGEWGPLA